MIAHSLTVSLLHVSSARLALADDPAEARAGARRGRAARPRERWTRCRHAVGTLHATARRHDRAAAGQHRGRRAGRELPRRRRWQSRAHRRRRPRRGAGHGRARGLPHRAGGAHQRRQARAAGPCDRARRRRGRRRRTSTSTAPAPRLTDRGLGLISMRERAEAIGGTCEAGPGGSGWRVHAELPVHARRGVPTCPRPRRRRPGTRPRRAARHPPRAVRLRHRRRVSGRVRRAVPRSERLRPDIVLMDVRMPGVDGVGATAALRRLADAPRCSCSPRSTTTRSSPPRCARARPDSCSRACRPRTCNARCAPSPTAGRGSTRP